MRIRTILAAAAAPAALAAVLLGTTGASAATTTATLTAATSGRAVTYQTSVSDTTSVSGPATQPSPDGPVWAHDSVARIVTWSQDKTIAGAYDVTVATEGTYHAFASPLTGDAWKGHGSMLGYVQYVVTPPAGDVPSASHLSAFSPNADRSGGILNELFGLPAGSSALVHAAGDGQYDFLYSGIPGAPMGWYFQTS